MGVECNKRKDKSTEEQGIYNKKKYSINLTA